MSSFDEEYKKIFDELKHELQEIDEIPPLPGLDETNMIKSHEATQKYNKKLLTLKAKYGIE